MNHNQKPSAEWRIRKQRETMHKIQWKIQAMLYKINDHQRGE